MKEVEDLVKRFGNPGPSQAEAPQPPRGHRNPGRRGLRAQQEARSRWIAYYSPLVKASATAKLKEELAKPTVEDKLKADPNWKYDGDAVQNKEKIAQLKDWACFTPYVRTQPKIRHQRGMIRRLAKSMQFQKDPPRVDMGNTGPEQ